MPYQQKAITSGVDFFESQQKHLENLEKGLDSDAEDSDDDESGEYESEEDHGENEKDTGDLIDTEDPDMARTGDNMALREIKPLTQAQ